MAIRSKDSYYDDVTNATMTSAFIIRHENSLTPINIIAPPKAETNPMIHSYQKQIYLLDTSKQKVAINDFSNIIIIPFIHLFSYL